MGSKQVGLEPPTTLDGRQEKGLICVHNTLIVVSITFTLKTGLSRIYCAVLICLLKIWIDFGLLKMITNLVLETLEGE